uniref:CSON001089 protein n=2 Tax=Culicoides sonorensis TaxID=179676 RepID=A0A336MFW6_CULSO
MFKTTLILIVSLVIYCEASAVSERRRIAEICKKGTSVTEDVVENLVKNNYVDVDPTPENSCYARCVATQFNFTKEDGDFNKDHIINNAPTDLKPKFTEYMDACKDEVGLDACQTTFKKNKCFFVKLEEGKSWWQKVSEFFG